MAGVSNDKYIQIRECIDRSYLEGDGMPSLRTIERETGIPKSTVSRALAEMKESGMLSYSEGRATTDISRKCSTGFVTVPLLGDVACGLPNFAEENIEEYFRLPTGLVGTGDFYLLRAKGDSMTEIGIESGDLVLIRRQNYAVSGDIAVVLAGDETTLKRYYPEPGKRRVRLHPENKSMCDIFVTECAVQGVATKVIKSI